MKGDLLIELKRSTNSQATKFKEKIKSILVEQAEVKILTHETLIEVKDLDEVTTKEDVFNALAENLANTSVMKALTIKSLRKAYSGTQTATVSLPAEAAKQLIEIGKVRIGWVVCRIREKLNPTKCYKCMEFGHIAKTCKSSSDWSKHCLRCGKSGHIAKLCNEEPKCLLCQGKEGIDNNHLTGSRRCPSYQRAWRELLLKQ